MLGLTMLSSRKKLLDFLNEGIELSKYRFQLSLVKEVILCRFIDSLLSLNEAFDMCIESVLRIFQDLHRNSCLLLTDRRTFKHDVPVEWILSLVSVYDAVAVLKELVVLEAH